MAARDVIIGTLTGIAAVAAIRLTTPKPQAATVIRELAAYPRPHGQASNAYATTQADSARQKLETILESVEMKRVPLIEAFAKLAQLTGANFIVEWRPLHEEAEVGTDYPITVSLRHVPVRIALKAMLDQVASQTEKLSFRAQDGIVRISTVRHLAREQFVRVYDIRDVIDDLYASEKGFPGRETELTRQEAVDQVTTTITRGVDAGSWREAGSSGSIEVFAGRLIVRQSLENHEAIAQIIADLRRKRK